MMRYQRNHLNGTSYNRNENYEQNNGCSCNRRNSVMPHNENNSPCRPTPPCNASTRTETGRACEGEQLLSLIRRLDFALVEINLYLDTHPHSHTALNYFKRLLRERNQAVERYETAFCPLTAAGNKSCDEWTWSTGAWPWQIDKENKR